MGHDELDVLRLHARLVNLALVLLLDLRLGRLHGGHLRGAELLRGSLRGGGKVLDLRLAENHVRVRVGVLVHVGLGHHEEDVLALLDRDARDVGDGLQAELQNRLAALLLAAGLLGATCDDECVWRRETKHRRGACGVSLEAEASKRETTYVVFGPRRAPPRERRPIGSRERTRRLRFARLAGRSSRHRACRSEANARTRTRASIARARETCRRRRLDPRASPSPARVVVIDPNPRC